MQCHTDTLSIRLNKITNSDYFVIKQTFTSKTKLCGFRHIEVFDIIINKIRKYDTFLKYNTFLLMNPGGYIINEPRVEAFTNIFYTHTK